MGQGIEAQFLDEMKQCPQENFPENGKKAVGFPKPHFEPSVSAASGTQCCMQALTACGIETFLETEPATFEPGCMQALTACGIETTCS